MASRAIIKLVGKLLPRSWVRRIACVAVAVQAGCGPTVVPPALPVRPTTVYLCDYGVHSSLLLPVDDRGRYVEYMFGDWNWAALDHTAWYDAVGAVFFSEQSTLGRRFLNARDGEAIPVPRPAPKTEVAVLVDGRGCRTVLARLDSRWLAHQSTAIPPMPVDGYFSYVKDDQSYSWLHDCNHLTADCLRQMGCEVHGVTVFSNFSVVNR